MQGGTVNTLRIRHQREAAQGTAHEGQDGPLGIGGRRSLSIVLGLDGHAAVLHREGVATGTLGDRLQSGQAIGREVVVPRPVADMLLYHHAVPLATGDVVVVAGTEQRVTTESLAGTFCPHVGGRVVLLGQIAVHGYGKVHLIEVRHGLHGEEDELLVGVALFGLQRQILAQGLGLQAHVVISHAAPLAGSNVISGGIHHLCRRASGILTAEVQDAGSLGGLLLTKLLTAERLRVSCYDVTADGTGIPGHIHK